MSQSTAIEQAIAAAHAAKEATKAANTSSTEVATHSGATQGSMTVAGPKAAPLSMDTVSTGQMVVDAWIKPKEFGLQVGDSALIEEITAVIDMTDGKGFVVKKGIKAGNPAQYAYTTDGATCLSGGTWEAAIAKMKAISPAAYEYRCVDLPFTLLEDVVVKGVTLAKAGQKLGYTTSTTNWKNWEEFYREVSQQGLLGEPVRVKLGAERRTNKAGNVWGVLTFELLGAMAEETAE